MKRPSDFDTFPMTVIAFGKATSSLNSPTERKIITPLP